MLRFEPKWHFAILWIALFSPFACSDVGDNSSTPPGSTTEGGADSSVGSPGTDSSADRTALSGDAPVDSPSDTAIDGLRADSSGDSTVSGHDAGMDSTVGTGVPEAGAPDMGTPETEVPETEAPEAGVPDAGAPDTGLIDAGSLDTGGEDAGPTDAAPDAAADTGAADTGATDSGAPDTSAADTGAHDAGSPETGGDSGPNPDCAANNGGADCTPTEALFESHAASCYLCLVNASCLNDVIIGDTGHECTDVVGNAAKGGRVGTPRSTLCMETLQCILQHSCASSDVAICYCGSLGAGNGCVQSSDPAAANGACKQIELDGLEHVATDPPSSVVPDFFNQALGAGKANQIFACGHNVPCPTCVQ
jgi:hypothetical protein